MESPSATIKFRLPIPIAITLSVGLGILFIYLITVVSAFVLQDSISTSIGINPAQVPIIILMIVLFIPWAVLGWFILKKYSKVGVLHLYTNHLTVSNLNNQVIKSYPAGAITMIKLQNNAAHFEFKDSYRFNLLNFSMGKNYNNELVRFNAALLAFINRNNIKVQQGRIL